MECDCDGNIRALIIEGEPTDQELIDTWVSIKAQYADAMANKKYVSFKTLFKEIGVLRLTLLQIEMLIDILSKVYHDDLASRLNKALKSSFQFNPDDEEKYKDTLEGCRIRSRKLKIDIDIKEMQYNALAEGDTDGIEAPTIGREHYLGILITLSNFVKYNLSDSISVFEFCERVNRYIKHCEKEKHQNNVGRINR